MKNEIALLIDADNISGQFADEMVKYLRKTGAALLVRRAYGGHEKLGAMKDVLRKHAVRAFVNLGKGTTDVALTVDAMDLLRDEALPLTVAIASSDADFAALAVRLREAGIRVQCFAHRLAADADALRRVYDQVLFDDEVAVAGSPIAAGSPVTQPPLSPMPAVAPVARPPVAVPIAALVLTSEPISEDVDAVRRILAALPEWRPDTVKQLNQLGTPLSAKNIKTGNKPLHEMFRKHPTYFKVLPTTGSPKQVKLLKKPAKP
ncbi:NYN domain-containing protein [Variovorax sp. RT4R15]|uniref:NYN domain-containing protein n=1 Tax=Variovorax sp. RT4R15 TaxID=3443737 RepID=UPI003F471E3E